MKLVFIYGPPAVGKLTVAKELLKLTGFKVFHNHLTIDLVKSIFEWGEGPFWELVDRFRLELVKAATEANIPGVIFTFVYAKTHDDGFVRRIVKVVEKGGGAVPSGHTAGARSRQSCDRQHGPFGPPCRSHDCGSLSTADGANAVRLNLKWPWPSPADEVLRVQGPRNLPQV